MMMIQQGLIDTAFSAEALRIYHLVDHRKFILSYLWKNAKENCYMFVVWNHCKINVILFGYSLDKMSILRLWETDLMSIFPQ